MRKARLIIGWIIGFVIFMAYNFKAYDNDYDDLTPFSFGIFLVFALLWYGLNWINIINEWERRPVLLFGKWKGSYGPGIVLIEPLFHTFLDDVDVQDKVVIIKAEKVQTKDNVGINLAGALTYRINHDKVRDVVIEVEDYLEALEERALSALTDEAAQTDLDHLLENRSEFSKKALTSLGERVQTWGMSVKAFEIQEFKIADQAIEQAIAMKAKAQKEGEAELARAKKQMEIVEALNGAAKKLTDEGWRLKGIETLIEMTRSAQNNTVLIPSDINKILSTAIALKE